MGITGFNHITIRVAHLERSLLFYHDLLQMKVVHRGNTDAYLAWGDAWVCLIEVNAAQAHGGYGVDHVAFTCDADSARESKYRLLFPRRREGSVCRVL